LKREKKEPEKVREKNHANIRKKRNDSIVIGQARRKDVRERDRRSQRGENWGK